MDNAARMRQRVLAVFLPLAAVLYVSAEALDPKGTDKVLGTVAGAFKELPIAAMHPVQLYFSGSLSLLALGALAAGSRVSRMRGTPKPNATIPIAAIATKARIDRKPGTMPVDPLTVVRYVVLAKASSFVGALFAGFFIAMKWVPVPEARPPPPTGTKR